MSLFKGTHTVTRANKISNFTVATAEYGAPVMEVLGTTRISGNVIYYDDFTAHEHRETQKSGKGGKSKSTSITYTYTVAVILGLCEGPVASIGKIWKDKEIYNYPDDNVPLTLFTGTADQQPWAYVVGKHPERALAYENLAYMAGVIDLGDSASMPSYNFEVRGKLLNTGDGIDVNPMDYILYVLSKVGQSNATFYGADNFRRYCAEADLLISTPADATGTDEAQKIVNEIAELCGAYVFWSNDAYKIVPLADRPVGIWEPDKTIRYDLTVDDFIPQNGSCITWARKDSSEQYNRFTVEFMNRENSYEKESVTYEDAADIAERGVKQAPTINAGYIYTKERAVVIAEAAARRNKVVKNQYQFKLGWAFCRLEPGDLVRITDEASGIIDQVVLIKDIQEDASGLLSVTAISWFANDYGAAEYDVHEVDRPSIDFNVPPGDTATPVIFQPPADLTTNGLEVWIAAKGQTNNWGGCTVYVSDDGEYYRTLGQITNNARFGPLATDITADATSLEVTVNGTMLSGTQQDAERANTMIWIDGECLSYETATLLQNGNYRLDGLIRGQYNTTATAHSSGAIMVRCDETLLRAPFAKEDIGKTLYLKFCSYNIFGAMEQSLADVNAYEYVLQAYYIPPVTNVTAYNRYRMIKDSVARYDIVVQWTPPNLQSYLEGQVWYKTDHGQTVNINDVAGVPVSQLGFQGDWIFGGSGKNQVVIPQAVVGDTYRIAVVTKDEWGASNNVDFAPQTTITVALRTETPNTPDDFALTFGNQITASWNEVTNSDIQFYEIRRDTNPGIESANLLARTSGTSTALTLTERTGTLYLYAKSPVGKYSAPAKLIYAKDVPPQPAKPDVSANLGSINIVAEAIPNGCIGMRVYINGDGIVSAFTENNTYTHSCEAGIYDVSVAYVDIFGEGQRSTESRIVIKKTIDAKLLEDEAINVAKVDGAIKTALENANNSAVQLLEVDRSIRNINIDLNAVHELAEGTRMDIDTTNDRISTVISNLNNENGTTYASISNLSQTVDGISTRVTHVEEQADAADIAISDNEDAIAKANRDILAVQSDVQQTASSLTSTIQMLRGSASDQNQFEAISEIKQQANGLSVKVDNLIRATDEGDTTAMTQLKTDVQALAGDISTVTSKLQSEPNASGQYTAISRLNQNYNGLVTQIDSVRTTANGNTTNINSLTTQMTARAGEITAITQKLNSEPDANNQYTAITRLNQNYNGITATVTENKTIETNHYNANVSAINTNAAAIQTNTSSINQQADRITTVVTALGDYTDNSQQEFSAIAQLKDSIELKVSKQDPDNPNSDLISQINLSPGTVRLAAKLITLDGTVQVNSNFLAKLIQAGMISAIKADISSLSALSANIGEFTTTNSTGKVVIKGSVIEVYSKSGSTYTLRVRLGLW